MMKELSVLNPLGRFCCIPVWTASLAYLGESYLPKYSATTHRYEIKLLCHTSASTADNKGNRFLDYFTTLNTFLHQRCTTWRNRHRLISVHACIGAQRNKNLPLHAFMCWHGTNNTLAFWSEHTIHSSIWITNKIKHYFYGRFVWDQDEDKSGRFRNRKMSVWQMSGQKLIWSHILSIFVTLSETLKENSKFLRYSIKWIVTECFRKRSLLSPARLHFRGFERHDLPDLKATLGLAFQVYVARD